jgi:hypothetical protein
VSVGGRFEGGGGSIPMRVWRGRLEPEIVTALEGCLDDTGASSAVFAYPET